MNRHALTQWALAAGCMFYACVRGTARRAPQAPQRVLIMQMAKLGDMVCTTPLMRAVKERYPDCRVVVMGNKVNGALLAGHPHVDEYIVFDGIASAIRRLRSERFDFVAITAPDMTSFAVAFLGNVRAIATPRIEEGHSPYETLAYRAVRPLAIVELHRMHHYAPREYLRLLEPIGITTDDTCKTLVHSNEASESVERFWREHGLVGKRVVGIAPAAGNKVKEWPSERFAALADRLIETYDARILVTGNGADKPQVEAVLAATQHPDKVVNAYGALTLEELKAAIHRLDLFIGSDTGPIYVAEAFGVPTVDIVGPVDEREQPPQGDRHAVVVPPPPRSPQLFVMDARGYDYDEARRQAESITVDAAFTAASRFLSGSRA